MQKLDGRFQDRLGKNFIINPTGSVNQRGSLTYTLTAIPIYCMDRWLAFAPTPMGVGFSPVGSVGEGQFLMQRPASDTTIGNIQWGQLFEGIEARQLAGKTVTFSFEVATGADFNPAGFTSYLRHGTVADEGNSGFTSGGWTGFGQDTQDITPVAANQGYTRYTHTYDVPSDVREFGVYFTYTTQGTAGANETFWMRNLQLEIGSVATEFVPRTHADEIALCQRYYQKSYELGTKPGTVTYNGTVVEFGTRDIASLAHGVAFPVPMRSTPVVIPYSAAGTPNAVSNTTDKTAVAATVSSVGFRYVSITGGTTVDCDYHWTAEAEL